MDPTPLILITMAPLLLVLGIGLVFLHMSSRQALKQLAAEPAPPFDTVSEPSWRVCRALLFRQPCRWLAVRCTNPALVQDALGLHEPTPCGWIEGITQLAEDRLFISPPVQGWVLVLGHALPLPEDDVDRLFHALREFSHKLGEVQYFAVNRVVDHHTWVKLVDGRVRRAYSWADETLWNDGEKTDAEKRLGMQCLDYGESRDHQPVLFGAATRPNAEKIFSLAARWSVDPSAIEPRTARDTLGLLGRLSDPRRARR